MATTGLRSLVVTTPGGVEGPPAKVASTELPALAHVVGYRPLIGLGVGEAQTKLEGLRGSEATIARESEVTEPTRKELMEMAHLKLETLIDERRKRSPDEFNRWLNDSMHGADLDFFSRFTKEVPGTEVFKVDEAKLNEFMGTDAGLILVAHMEQRDAEEARMADNVLEALGPESPGPSVLRETVHEIQGSGPLRRAVRGINYWLRTPSGRPGGRGLETANTQGDERIQRLFVDTNGRITATVTGSALGAASLAAGSGFLVGNLVLPGVGGALGAGVGAGAGAITALLAAEGVHLFRRGETTGIELSPQALMYMLGQNNATIEWSKAMSGINPLDRTLLPGGRGIQMRPGHVSEAGMNTRDRQERHEARALRLRRIQDKLGIRNEYQDTNIMRWLMEGSLLRPEPGTKFMKDVMEEFDPNNETRVEAAGGGVRDMNGNSFWEPDPAAPNGRRRNPNFNPAQLNTFENIDRWRQAYDRVLRREITIIASDILANKADSRGKLLEVIKEKRKAKSADKERRLSQLGKEVAAYKKDGERLGSGEKGAGKRLSEFQTSIAKTRGEIDKTLASITIGGIGATSLEAASRTLAGLIDGSVAGPVVIEGQSITSLAQQRRQLDSNITSTITRYNRTTVDPLSAQVNAARTALEGTPAIGAAPAIPGQREIVASMPVGTPAEVALKTAAQARLANLEQSLQALQAQLTTAIRERPTRETLRTTDFAYLVDRMTEQRALVKKVQESIVQEQRKLESAMGSTNETRANASEVIESLRPAMDTIIGWGVVGLDQAALENQSFDELMRRITTTGNLVVGGVYTPGAPNGWPAGERFDEANRLLVLRGMVEAQAIAAEPSVGAPTTRLPDIIAAGGIPEIDLLLLSSQEILDLSMRRGVPAPPLNAAESAAAKDEATRRFNARQTALNNIQRALEVRQRRVDAEEKRIREKGIETPELDAMERIVGRFDAIRDGIMDNEDQLDFLDRFLSLDNVPALAAGGAAPIPNAVFADYERPPAASLTRIPEAVVRIRRLIADHTNDSQASFRGQNGPEAAYARDRELITDNDIRDLLVQGLNLGGMIPGVPALGIAPTPIPIPNVRMAIRLARIATGLDPTPPAWIGILNRTMITPVEVSRCLSQDLFRMLAERVEKY